MAMRTASDSPLLDQYRTLLRGEIQVNRCNDHLCEVIGECELPLIDLSGLRSCHGDDKKACVAAITRASSELGFFQVMNHGISGEFLGDMRREQVKVFQTPIDRNASCGFLNDSYRWGSPTATSVKNFSWSEAFHIPLTKISDETCYGDQFGTLREVLEKLAAEMSKLAQLLAGVLAKNLGSKGLLLEEICNENTCFLRLNRYPKCPISPEIFGLVPHTDSDFLTILCQDQVGGLQLMKDSKWVAVKPNQDALIVNIGDLFQAWSNNEYKSVEHRVMTNGRVERYSIAYLLCPSYDSFIGCCIEPSIYRKFTFGEYRRQVQEDVRQTGHKVGLPKFLL
ncbi:gibberellin 2-beta-dioxygenase 6-like [Macadamia integrifolia]|uniref:gibberellin 2-beta-dioxygenase 6-like n=1 Tax=Macadamia integrifolia TaxID=60698 RepID=UPI001C4F1650|nr:gibberellin 2-beta-dioxygenase 6-like [Macadamia integrifolia]